MTRLDTYKSLRGKIERGAMRDAAHSNDEFIMMAAIFTTFCEIEDFRNIAVDYIDNIIGKLEEGS